MSVATVSISTGLFVATMANRALKAKAVVRTLLIWPYAVAPAISGILWLFLLHPSYGVIALAIKRWFGVDWNPVLRGSDAMFMIIMASAWKQISYNFVFFIAGLQAIPKSLIEAAAIDGASPFRRFWTITVPLLFADAVFRYGHEHHLFIFRDLRCCSYDDAGWTRRSYEYTGVQGLSGRVHRPEYGGVAAQSIVLMTLIIAVTLFQFKYVEKKVQYAG